MIAVGFQVSIREDEGFFERCSELMLQPRIAPWTSNRNASTKLKYRLRVLRAQMAEALL